jgi:hypothetical protein
VTGLAPPSCSPWRSQARPPRETYRAADRTRVHFRSACAATVGDDVLAAGPPGPRSYLTRLDFCWPLGLRALRCGVEPFAFACMAERSGRVIVRQPAQKNAAGRFFGLGDGNRARTVLATALARPVHRSRGHGDQVICIRAAGSVCGGRQCLRGGPGRARDVYLAGELRRGPIQHYLQRPTRPQATRSRPWRRLRFESGDGLGSIEPLSRCALLGVGVPSAFLAGCAVRSSVDRARGDAGALSAIYDKCNM